MRTSLYRWDTAAVAVIIVLSAIVGVVITDATMRGGHPAEGEVAATLSSGSASSSGPGVRPLAVAHAGPVANSTNTTLTTTTQPTSTSEPRIDPPTTSPSVTAESAGVGWNNVTTFESSGDPRSPSFFLSGTTFRVTYTGPTAELVVERVDRSAAADLGICRTTCTIVVRGPIIAAEYDVYVAATATLFGSWQATVEEQSA